MTTDSAIARVQDDPRNLYLLSVGQRKHLGEEWWAHIFGRDDSFLMGDGRSVVSPEEAILFALADVKDISIKRVSSQRRQVNDALENLWKE